ncbi:hypothetical protein K492DRAFT_190691 [Lichtheimia hyalospora FSU 10163]|nr:hypothetical protein K492DRAFT_190691 [Lichtheimia hyalospora FSU 10163]
MEAAWATYKNKPSTSSIYTEDAVVIYLPSGAGARGNAQIRRFYLQPDFKAAQIQEQVHGTVMSGNKVMEEVEWTITFHGSECNWLVPTVDEGLLMNATVKIPVMLSATFSGDQISVLRVHWDQASVLKQLRVISDRNKWPVRSGETVDALRNPTSVPLNPFAPNNELATPLPASTTKKTLAIDAPGRIFGPIRPEDQVGHSVRRNLHGPHRNIFSYEPPAEKPLVTTKPDRLGSSFSFTHDEGAPATPTPSANRKATPKENNIFGQQNGHSDDDLLASKTANLSMSTSSPNRRTQQSSSR